MAQQTDYTNAAGLQAQLVRPGQNNSAGDARALYLKLFSGEMFKGFQNNTIARDLVMKRTLKNGKSLQFIYTGRTVLSTMSLVRASSVTPMVHLRWQRRPSPVMTF